MYDCMTVIKFRLVMVFERRRLIRFASRERGKVMVFQDRYSINKNIFKAAWLN